MKCTTCGNPVVGATEHALYRYRKTGRVYCQPSCGYAHREATRPARPTKKTVQCKCEICGQGYAESGWRLHNKFRTCSVKCSTAARAKVSSATASATNRKYASARMRVNNPMHNEATRDKMRRTLKGIGHAPTVRGGNGRGPTAAEQVLLSTLSPFGFVGQYIVRTCGYPKAPPHYKLDLALPDAHIAVEVDGASHCATVRKEQDRRKEAFLHGAGWTLFRFTNQQVLTDPTSITLKLIRYIHTLREGS